ncbi:MAG: PSD1 and planctomycete cytochrome C domain-containing protein [Gemmataceae bacterium]
MRGISLTLIVTLACAAPPAWAEGNPGVSFERDILPVFKSRCFSCHDARKQTGGYRIDVRSLALKGGESKKPAIVPGKVAASDLFRRISSDEAEVQMPPSGKRLTARQVADIKAWIEAGAPWPDALANEKVGPKHWAFVAPQRPAIPATRQGERARTPIDRFILARLDREGLVPSLEADRLTLVRRLYLDLIGLPPTPEEADAFATDKRPDAYERLVDRLLASPLHGERWGRLWLDAARYADSDGFEKDKPRFVWFYRDWVVSAHNRDLPYDRFILEQIAGDLLPDAGQEQLVATGYLRNSMINEEGGIDPEQFRMEAMFDRMDAIGKGVLGLTIQCGQCHSHKYDPLTQTEYYRMFAFLNNAHEANVTAYTALEQMKRADLLRRIREIEEDLRHRTPDWPARLVAWEKKVAPGQPKWTVLRPRVYDESTGGQKYLLQPDGSFLAQGYAPTKHRVHMEVKVPAGTITAFQLELLTDPNLPRGGPGRSVEGTGALSEFDVEWAPAEMPTKKQAVKWRQATADVEMPVTPLKSIYEDKSGKKRILGPVAFAIDGKDETAWGIDSDPGRRNQPRKAVFTLQTPIQTTGGAILHIYLKQYHGGWNSDDNQNNNLGRMRLSITDQPGVTADPLPATVRATLGVPVEKRSPAQQQALFSYWRSQVPEWKEAHAQIEALWKQHPEGSTQLALSERDQMRATHTLKRGDFLKPGDAVEAGVPAFLHPLPEGAPASRLAFGRWLGDRRSPTTARAYVNRVWQAYFGAGLVTSPEDLGTQAEAPSHPELLDWLAVEFMESGWSMKHLHRLIVLSATYRQASKVSGELAARDPYNRFLARGPRFRVDAEVVRDIALASSGLLMQRLGGPSVYPPLPGFLLLPPASYGPKVWKEESGPDRYRRALYTFRFRSVPYPALQTFDAPNGDFACVKRTRSNTPLQALTALNEPVFLESARGLAGRILTEGATDRERLIRAFRLCLVRPPSDEEVGVLTELLQKQRARFATAGARPDELLAGGPAMPPGVVPAEAAAWVSVARVLLNLDETITKE